MAKKKKTEDTQPAPPPSHWKPPTPTQERKWAAESAARVAVATDMEERKERKQKEKSLTDEILAVMSKRLD